MSRHEFPALEETYFRGLWSCLAPEIANRFKRLIVSEIIRLSDEDLISWANEERLKNWLIEPEGETPEWLL